MSLKVTVKEKRPGIFFVTPEGSLDTNTYIILENEVNKLLNTSTSMMVFDLEKLDYISSMGVRVIAKAKKFLKRTEGITVILNLQPQIKKVFEIIKAMPSEQIFESVEELDQYLDTIQKGAIE